MSAVLAPTTQDRSAFRWFRALARAANPELWGVYEYSVFSTSGSTIQANLTDPTQPPPSVVNVPIRPGIAGAKTVPANGSLCYVAFANGDRSKPVVIAFDTTRSVSLDVESAGIVLNASGAAGSARKGDAVNAGYLVTTSTGLVVSYFPGTTAGHVAAESAAAGLTPPGVVVSMTSGAITSGSSTVTVGA